MANHYDKVYLERPKNNILKIKGYYEFEDGCKSIKKTMSFTYKVLKFIDFTDEMPDAGVFVLSNGIIERTTNGHNYQVPRINGDMIQFNTFMEEVYKKIFEPIIAIQSKNVKWIQFKILSEYNSYTYVLTGDVRGKVDKRMSRKEQYYQFELQTKNNTRSYLNIYGVPQNLEYKSVELIESRLLNYLEILDSKIILQIAGLNTVNNNTILSIVGRGFKLQLPNVKPIKKKIIKKRISSKK